MTKEKIICLGNVRKNDHYGLTISVLIFLMRSLPEFPGYKKRTKRKNEKKTHVDNALESVKQPKKKMFVTRITELGYWDLYVRRNVGRGRSQLNFCVY